MDLENFSSVYYSSPIGTISITGNNLFICEIRFINELVTKSEFSQNTNGILSKCMDELDQYFKGTLRNFTIPLKQTGTEFQKRIWNMLQEIPFGKQWSYLELAKKSGSSTNTRAVGHANGKNKLAIVVPCHRVIGSNGMLTGYAGELWRKAWMLEHEAKFAHGVKSLFNAYDIPIEFK